MGDHAVSAAGFLTGVWPKRTEAEDVLANTTIDQVVAQQIGQDTPFPSLEVATEDFTGYVGACSPGFNCAYLNTISWSTPSTPLPMDINPRVVFERMFGQAGSRGAARGAACATSAACSTRSAEEAVGCSAASARATARASTSISTTCARSSAASSAPKRSNGADVTFDAPVGVPDSFEEHAALMYDLLAVAYQADVTRVFTFMLSRELSQRTYPQIGVTEQHHSVSHHGNDPQKIAQNVKVNTYHATLFAQVPREAAGDARRRRLAARSLADHLRRRHGQSQPARQRSAAGGRRRRRRRQGPSPRQAARRGRRSATCG